MKTFYKALLSAVLFPVLSFAQSNYKPGYIVNLKGDTLKGFIDYREWNLDPNAIDFKAALTDKDSKKFTASDISYFAISGADAYQRYSGLISMDATDKDKLGDYRDTTYKNATVFIRVLQKGKNLSLYSYTDNLKVRFYVGEAPEYIPNELIYRLYYNQAGNVVKGQSGATVNESTYMKQLFALANQYGILNNDVQREIERADYKKDDLLSIVSEINHISKDELKKSIQSKGPIYNLFVSAGANINHITTTQNSPYYAGGGRPQNSSMPAASLGINLFANPSTRQLQFRIEAGVALSKYNYSYDLKVSPYGPFRTSFNEAEFSISPQIIYNFYNTDDFKFYAGVGVTFSEYSFSNAYFGPQNQSNSASNISDTNPFYFHKRDDTFLFKLGAQIQKNWGVFGQYSSGVAVEEGGYFAMSSKVIRVGLNYYFW
ncbi:MAG: hypothetical protein JST50_08515 [Bacteroidetes bacterium]|jgi:hypothetical protein|nr:hypothetical protein [Bacteroidota bacterium]